MFPAKKLLGFRNLRCKKFDKTFKKLSDISESFTYLLNLMRFSIGHYSDPVSYDKG